MTATHTVAVWLPSISAEKKRVQWQWPPSTTVCSQCRQCMRPKSGEVCIQWWAGPRRAAEAFCATFLRRRRQRFFPSAPAHGTDSQHYVSTSVQLQRHGFQAKCHQHWDTVWFNLVGSTEVLPLSPNTRCFYCAADIPTISKKILVTLVHVSHSA